MKLLTFSSYRNANAFARMLRCSDAICLRSNSLDLYYFAFWKFFGRTMFHWILECSALCRASDHSEAFNLHGVAKQIAKCAKIIVCVLVLNVHFFLFAFAMALLMFGFLWVGLRALSLALSHAINVMNSQKSSLWLRMSQAHIVRR